MNPHRLSLSVLFVCLVFTAPAGAQKQRTPPGGRLAVVVDERLAALRTTPQLDGKLIRRLGRGRRVAIRTIQTGRDGIVFFLVNVTSRTHGWIQREALVSPSRKGDDSKLLDLIKSSIDFDRISRARIFLDHFPGSPFRPEVLLLLGDAAEQATQKLSVDAARRLKESTGAPEFSYFLNYSGLDRYNRQGIRFVFDATIPRFHYDGAAFRQLVRQFPKSPQAYLARERLDQLRR